MRSLVPAELLKLRATRTAWIPLAAALALAVVAVLASTTAAGPDAAPHLSPAALPGLLRGSGGQLLAATAAAALAAHHVPLAWGQPGVLGTITAVPLLAALSGILGAGLGLLLRHTAAALGLALIWAFVIEGIIPALTHQPGITRWLPQAAANAVLHGASPAATALSAGAALAVLAGYAAVLAGAGAALTVRREIGTTTG